MKILLPLDWFLPLLLLSPKMLVLANNKTLTFMLVTSWDGFGYVYNSSGTIPAAEIALRSINSCPDLLPGYNLVYDKVRDSKVSTSYYHS